MAWRLASLWEIHVGTRRNGESARPAIATQFVKAGFARPIAELLGVLAEPYNSFNERIEGGKDVRRAVRAAKVSVREDILRSNGGEPPDGGKIEHQLLKIATELHSVFVDAGSVRAAERLALAITRLTSPTLSGEAEDCEMEYPQVPTHAPKDEQGRVVGMWR